VGTPEVVSDKGWRIPGHSAIVLQPGGPEEHDGGSGEQDPPYAAD
jgi:hypothetical protein